MRQRVKVAQAIAHDPDLLILDEPLSGTDPVGRVRIMNVVKDMARKGKNVIISSHVLHDIERLTRNVVLINKGWVIAQGDVHAIRGLIDRFPHIVKVRTKEGRRLAKALSGDETVVSIEFEEDGVVVKTRKPDVFYAELPRILTENNIQFSELTSPDDNLDAVFRYLVEGG
jgi:ABC-2 type transport system ATP-binding protein